LKASQALLPNDLTPASHDNYGRTHMTLKETPAMASGLAIHVWSIRELIEESAKF